LHRLAPAAAVGLVVAAAQAQDLGPTVRRPPAELGSAVVTRDRPVYSVEFSRPDLRPIRANVRAYSGTGFDACVEVTNDGAADSQPTTVRIGVVVANPQTLGGVSSATFDVVLPAVRLGERPREVCTGYSVPNRTADWDIHVNALVDPNNTVQESNESNNQALHDCRLFGPNPGTYRTQGSRC